MRIHRLIDEIEAHRQAGTLTAPGDSGNNSDVLVGLLWEFLDRAQLDRIVAGIPGADAVAERAERALRLRGPVQASDDDIETWGYACLEEWVGLARRRCSPGPVLDAFEALGAMAVEVVPQDEQSDEASFRLNGSLLGMPATGTDSELTIDQLAMIHNESFELLAAEFDDGGLDNWDGLDILFRMALHDEPTFGGWLLSPAASWEFDFEPFYNLWRAGVSLFVSPDMIEAVEGSAIWGDSAFGSAPAVTATISDADAAWAQAAGPQGEAALALIEARKSPGGSRLELIDAGLTSLPPALAVDGGWVLLDLSGNPGLDPSRLSELDALEVLVVRGCELASFDITLPPGLTRISLYKNKLTRWPAHVGGASTDLVRLDLQYNQLTHIPDEVAELVSLQDLSVGGNELVAVSPAIARLSNLQYLRLNGNRSLATLPEEILELSPDCGIALHSTALPESFRQAKTIGQLREVWGDLD